MAVSHILQLKVEDAEAQIRLSILKIEDAEAFLRMLRLFWPLPLALFSAFFLPWGLAPPKREKNEKTKPMAMAKKA